MVWIAIDQDKDGRGVARSGPCETEAEARQHGYPVSVPFVTRDGLKRELTKMRRAFRAAGGRGCILADEIDFYSSALRKWPHPAPGAESTYVSR